MVVISEIAYHETIIIKGKKILEEKKASLVYLFILARENITIWGEGGRDSVICKYCGWSNRSDRNYMGYACGDVRCGDISY